MKALSHAVRARRRVAIDAAIVLIIVLLMAQMWLLTATLESFLAGHHAAALPGALVSLVLFVGCFGLYLLVIRLDRAPEPDPEPRGFGPWDIR
jgi:hypothetical protein